MLRTIALMMAAAMSGTYFGYVNGVNAQKAHDQVVFDSIEKERTDQKAKAAEILAALNQKIITTQAESAKFKSQLESQRATHNQAINDLHTQYSSTGLFFTATKSPGDRDCGGSTGGSQGDATSACNATIIQLSDSVARDLRQLAYEADRLAVEYETCFKYVNR